MDDLSGFSDKTWVISLDVCYLKYSISSMVLVFWRINQVRVDIAAASTPSSCRTG
jgi:hypothetical protein